MVTLIPIMNPNPKTVNKLMSGKKKVKQKDTIQHEGVNH